MQNEKTVGDKIIVVIANSLIVIPPVLILRFLFRKKTSQISDYLISVELAQSNRTKEKVQMIIGITIAVVCSCTAVVLTVIINTNLSLKVSNDIVLTILLYFGNQFTINQALKIALNGSIIYLLKAKKISNSFLRSSFMMIVDRDTLNLFSDN